MRWDQKDLDEYLTRCVPAPSMVQVGKRHGFAVKEAKQPSKYRNKRVTYGGAVFDSQGELARYQELELLERSGIITELRRQVPFIVIPPLVINGKHEQATIYRADYTYKEEGRLVVEDFKGVRTSEYKLKRKLLFKEHGIAIRETGYGRK